MKRLPFALTFFVAASAVAAPAVPVQQAVALAQQHLRTRDASGQYYIFSVRLEPTDARRSTFKWAVEWSEPIPLDAIKKEVGVEIDMTGALASVVRGPANKDPVTGKFDPNGRTGLQNPRTRSDRPSILDLKR